MNDSPLPSASPRWGQRIVLVLFVAVLLPVGMSLLYVFSPTEYAFYPRCLLFWATGLHCPGCGGTRCVHALLHGDLPQALAFNPLFVLALPILAYGGLRIIYETWTGKRAARFRLPGWLVKVLVGGIIAYAIARNIPIYPFTELAPHELADRVALGINEADQVESQDKA